MMNGIAKPRVWKSILFASAATAATALASEPLVALITSGRPADYYSHIPLIPVVSAYVFFRRRKKLSWDGSGSPFLGIMAMALGFGLVMFDLSGSFDLVPHAELRVGGSLLMLYGSFLALYGTSAFRKVLFPLIFLVFLIPLPLTWMRYVVSALVTSSIGATHLLFRAFGIPFFQTGPIFYLPGFDIEVAQECSGIRSSLALLITSVLAGQIFLKGPWKKLAFAAAVFPVTVLKNAIRILTLYLLSYFIDIRIIRGGFLHRSGGFIFFGVGLIIMAYILWLLKSPREALERVKRMLSSPQNRP